MPDPIPQAIVTANGDILASVSEQIKELHPGVDSQAEVAAILKELQNLQNLGGVPGDTNNTLGDAISEMMDIQKGVTTWRDSGGVLGDLDTLKNLMAATLDDPKYKILASVITQIEELLNYRPDVTSVLSDLDAIKSLKGGPADATAFHDFNVLQIAFENIWVHAFDKNLTTAVENLYAKTIQLYDDAGLEVPDLESIEDVSGLRDFIAKVQSTLLEPGVGGGGLAGGGGGGPTDPNIINYFPEAVPLWSYLSANQQNQMTQYAKAYDKNNDGAHDSFLSSLSKLVDKILKNPDGTSSRIQKLILEIGEAIAEPYAFDVFAPNSYNFGIMLTYRQQWVPGPYQAGDLRATIPLAPGETRKYSKKTSVKTARAAKEIEKSMSSRSDQSSVIRRAEAEIMQKTTTDTNFKMTAEGSFNIGVGDIKASTEFGLKQAVESSTNKRDFLEATRKAAEEYRLERSVEVDTTSAVETEETTSGEISNPNNELTVTYLFYELQRRYTITGFIYRARPVILVAQEVPAPHEIDEAWLIEHQWILSRVLLDDTFRSALSYLNSGFAGDEVSIEVLRVSWEK